MPYWKELDVWPEFMVPGVICWLLLNVGSSNFDKTGGSSLFEGHFSDYNGPGPVLLDQFRTNSGPMGTEQSVVPC